MAVVAQSNNMVQDFLSCPDSNYSNWLATTAAAAVDFATFGRQAYDTDLKTVDFGTGVASAKSRYNFEDFGFG